MLPIPSNISFNYSTSVLTWTVNSSRGVSLIEEYHIEYNTSSSQCTDIDIHTKEVDLDDVRVEGVSTARAHIQLEHDANYTLRIKSSNYLNNSLWSSEFNLYLPSKGIPILFLNISDSLQFFFLQLPVVHQRT